MFITLLKKDFLLELREKQSISSFCVILGTLLILFYIALQNSFISNENAKTLLPFLIWIPFFVSAAGSVYRVVSYEEDSSALNSLLSLGIRPEMIFLSKTVSLTVIYFVLQTLAVLLLLDGNFGNLVLISFFTTLGTTSLGVLFAFLSVHIKGKGSFLSIMLLPLVLPLLSGAALGLMENSIWISFLTFLALLYTLLGTILSKFAMIP